MSHAFIKKKFISHDNSSSSYNFHFIDHEHRETEKSRNLLYFQHTMKPGIKIQNQVCLNPKISTTLRLFSVVPNEKKTYIFIYEGKVNTNFLFIAIQQRLVVNYCAILKFDWSL